MEKVITLLLAAGLVIGAASAANAVDIKAKGRWHNADVLRWTVMFRKTQRLRQDAECHPYPYAD